MIDYHFERTSAFFCAGEVKARNLKKARELTVAGQHSCLFVYSYDAFLPKRIRVETLVSGNKLLLSNRNLLFFGEILLSR